MLQTHSMKKRKYNKQKLTSREEYEEIKKENKRKLEEIMTTPNWLEVYGRKYYPDNWIKHLDKNHPERAQRVKENNDKAAARARGEHVPYMIPQTQLPVKYYDVNTKKCLGTFKNSKEASMTLNTSTGDAILRCCRGEHKTAGGYIWKFKQQRKKK